MPGPVAFLDWIIEKLRGPAPTDDDLVEAARSAPLAAEVMAAHLESSGIKATVFAPAAFTTGVPYTQGARVMVFRRDLVEARAILAEVDAAGEGAAEPPAGDGPGEEA